MTILTQSAKDTKQAISRLATRLSQLSVKVELLVKQIDESREYSYSFDVHLLEITELKPRESVMKTTEPCVRIFHAIWPNTTVRDIDIAHRGMPPASAENLSSASLFDKFAKTLWCCDGKKRSVVTRDIGLP